MKDFCVNLSGIKQFLKFLCFSLGAGIIELVSFTLITLEAEGEVWLLVAEVISVVLSCLFNFTLNRKYTFKAANNIVLGMLLYGAYYAVATPVGAMFIISLTRLGVNEFLAKAIKMLINFVIDFCYCKFFIFKIGKKKINSPPPFIDKTNDN